MDQDNSTTDPSDVPDILAKRLFLMTLAGMVAYLGFVLALMSSAD